MSKPTEIPIEKIVPSPYQPRLEFDLEDLKGSIMKDGILVPITVRMVEGNYELIDGERRTRLARELGMMNIPATVIEIDDTTARRMVWKVNTLRKDYKPEEKARYFKKLQDEGMSIKGIARECDLDRMTVLAHINVFILNEKYQKYVWNGPLSVTHIQELATMFNGGVDTPQIYKWLNEVMQKKLTSKEFREVLRPELKEIEKSRVESAQKAVETVVPEMKVPESPDDLRMAAEALHREARRKEKAQKTPEQLEAERQERERNRVEIAEKRRLKAKADKKIREEREAERKKLDEERKQLYEERKRLEAEAKAKREAERKRLDEERKQLSEERNRLEDEAETKLTAERTKLEAETEAKLSVERRKLQDETRQKFEEEKKKLEEAAKASIAVLNLPPEIMSVIKTFASEEVSPKAMTPRKARLLVPLERPKQLELAKLITERGMTISQIKSAIKKAEEVETIIARVQRESLRKRLEAKYLHRIFDADVKPKDIAIEINRERGLPIGPKPKDILDGIKRRVDEMRKPYMDNSFVRNWMQGDRHFIQATIWMDFGEKLPPLVRDDRPENEFRDFDEADRFAELAGGYCTGLVTLKGKKYWCIFVKP